MLGTYNGLVIGNTTHGAHEFFWIKMVKKVVTQAGDGIVCAYTPITSVLGVAFYTVIDRTNRDVSIVITEASTL